jgi:hypothetical protein
MFSELGSGGLGVQPAADYQLHQELANFRLIHLNLNSFTDKAEKSVLGKERSPRTFRLV